MATWQAKIIDKGTVQPNGTLKVTVVAVRDAVVVSSNIDVVGAPATIQQAIQDRIVEFAGKWNTAGTLPGVNDLIDCLTE